MILKIVNSKADNHSKDERAELRKNDIDQEVIEMIDFFSVFPNLQSYTKDKKYKSLLFSSRCPDKKNYS